MTGFAEAGQGEYMIPDALLSDMFLGMKLVAEESQTRFDPALDQSWSDVRKLRWHAATIRVNTGVLLTVEPQRERPTQYNVTGPGFVAATGFYGNTSDFLRGVEVGLGVARRGADS